MLVWVLEACLTFAWWAPCGTSVKGKVDEEVLLWLPRHFLNSCSRRLGPEAPWEGVGQCLLKCNLFTPHKEECLGILGSHRAPSSEPLPLSVSAWPLGPWNWCICQLWLKRKHCQLLEGKGRVGTCPSLAAQGLFLSPTSMQSSFQGYLFLLHSALLEINMDACSPLWKVKWSLGRFPVRLFLFLLQTFSINPKCEPPEALS